MLEQQESLLCIAAKQISPTIVASGADIPTQLGLLRAELAAAQQKYTADHPDVKRLKLAIAALAAQAKLRRLAASDSGQSRLPARLDGAAVAPRKSRGMAFDCGARPCAACKV